jgi:hypothetical protein
MKDSLGQNTGSRAARINQFHSDTRTQSTPEKSAPRVLKSSARADQSFSDPAVYGHFTRPPGFSVAFGVDIADVAATLVRSQADCFDAKCGGSL